MSLMETGGFSIADAMALSQNNCCNDGMFGGNGMWVFFLFFLLAAGNGGGLFGGDRDAAAQGALTRAELNDGLSFNQLENSIRGIQNGISEGFYTHNAEMMNGFNQIGNTMAQGFGGLNTAIIQSGYNTERAIADSRFAAQQCCCETNRNIDAVRYEGAKNTCDVITAGTMNTRDIIDSQQLGIQRVIDIMTNDKIETLRDRAQLAELQLSNNYQTQNLIHALRPFPQPAYITCSPYETNSSIYGTCPCA